MKVVLSGVETNNKGAELMLYAILQELEWKFSDAKVYLPYAKIRQGTSYVETSMDIRIIPFSKIMSVFHLFGLFSSLHVPRNWMARMQTVRDADWFLDGSGFAFGDQWKISDDVIQLWESKLRMLHERGCKIVFLPQAFGPIEKDSTKEILSVLSKYATAMLAREPISYSYLAESGVVDMDKVKVFPDFTSLVEGRFPAKYEHLRDGVCIIPNNKMIRQNMLSYEAYIQLLSAMALEGKKSGHPVYLLNHEGARDAALCQRCKQSVGDAIEVVTSLNALEVKGLIASAYMVVTSRFHGLASALNSGVPSLATSWSHKYEALFRDYGIERCVLPLDSVDAAVGKVKELLDSKQNQSVREHLDRQVPLVKSQVRDMWQYIWSL